SQSRVASVSYTHCGSSSVKTTECAVNAITPASRWLAWGTTVAEPSGGGKFPSAAASSICARVWREESTTPRRLTGSRWAENDEMRTGVVGEEEWGVRRDIERAAGRSFYEVGMPEIAEDEPLPVAELAGYQRAGRAWVAVDGADRPVAYLIADFVDDC